MNAQGQSLAKIGKSSGVDGETVHSRLREQGVRMDGEVSATAPLPRPGWGKWGDCYAA
jgi:hypothetical protein